MLAPSLLGGCRVPLRGAISVAGQVRHSADPFGQILQGVDEPLHVGPPGLGRRAVLPGPVLRQLVGQVVAEPVFYSISKCESRGSSCTSRVGGRPKER